MKTHLKLARIAGVELRLHYSWIAIAILVTLSLGARFHSTNPSWSQGTIWGISLLTGALFFAALFAHELAHALVAKSRGLPIHRITLFFLGGMAQIEREASDAATEFWMAIAGPLASIGIGTVCLGLARVFFGWHWAALPQQPAAAVLVWLGYINLILAVFNLIPGYPMDGGRVLRAALWRITGDGDKATRIAARTGQAVGVLFILWGMYRVLGGGGFGALWIALIGWFLVQAAGATLVHSRTAALLRGVTVAAVMSRSCAPVDGSSDVQTLVNTRVAHGQRCFLVYDGGRIAGMLTAADLRRVDKKHWQETPLWRVAQPLERIPSVTPQSSAMDALEKMKRDSNSDLLVVGDGYLHGVVSQADIVRFLQIQAELRAA